MSFELTKAVLDAGKKLAEMGCSPTQILILARLASRANNDHACWPSTERTAQDVGIKERMARRSIEFLEVKKLLVREKLTTRRTNTYKINAELVGRLAAEVNRELITRYSNTPQTAPDPVLGYRVPSTKIPPTQYSSTAQPVLDYRPTGSGVPPNKSDNQSIESATKPIREPNRASESVSDSTDTDSDDTGYESAWRLRMKFEELSGDEDTDPADFEKLLREHPEDSEEAIQSVIKWAYQISDYWREPGRIQGSRGFRRAYIEIKKQYSKYVETIKSRAAQKRAKKPDVEPPVPLSSLWSEETAVATMEEDEEFFG